MKITDVDGLLPDPRSLLEGTDWASLEHACGSAAGTAALLAGLLADDIDTQASALRHLNDPVHHQNTIYSVTVPAAAFVAKIIKDPRTDTVVASRDAGRLPLRAALLDWVGSVATEVGTEAEAQMARVGLCLEKHPESVHVRALRPDLFHAVSAFLHAPDLAIQEAALAAAVPLLDAPELVGQRALLTPLIRGVLVSSDNRSYRFIAGRGLRSWG
ncbi:MULTISPECIES: hypothetical protein [unclassified Streptomyces]|uniref:hypothetical protein n=1 Tax=unclassified Streptomyces TaxID=2593676 RepID=UPI00114CECD6|nr:MULTISPECIES: hypothetical protein [unclassified Streptomyces]MYS22777.1 hypothetical protein [Streptomyces sp. SID4948]